MFYEPIIYGDIDEAMNVEDIYVTPWEEED
jgi:hypothetical protein